MDIQRAELLEKYRLTVLQAPPADRPKGREKLFVPSVRYLNNAKPRQRLLDITSDVLAAIIDPRMSVDLSAVRDFFLIFENYAINLLDCPWKREFRKITMYSGFYKTRIEPLLKDPQKLMLLIGYEQVGMCLELKKLPDTNKLQDVALEFFLASVECGILLEIFQKSYGFTVKEIYDCRKSTHGDSEILLNKLRAMHNVGDRLQFKGRGVDMAFKKPIDDSEEKLNLKPVSKPSDFEIGPGYSAPVGQGHFEISRQQTASEILARQHQESDTETNGCDKKTDSIEAMLQAITPEMTSDANIRKQILMKLIPTSVKPDAASVASSLPLLQNSASKQSPVDTRPYTEPLLLPAKESPRNLQDVGRSASGSRTEPLMIPRRASKPRGGDSKPNTWQCFYCSFVNNMDINNKHQLCSSCSYQRKDA